MRVQLVLGCHLEQLFWHGINRQHRSRPFSELLMHHEHCDQRKRMNWGVLLSWAEVPFSMSTMTSVTFLCVLHRC
jgi:hypothetical protein